MRKKKLKIRLYIIIDGWFVSVEMEKLLMIMTFN